MLLEGIIYKYEFKNNMASNAEKLYNLIANDSKRKQSLFLTALTNPKSALDKICAIGKESNILVTKRKLLNI